MFSPGARVAKEGTGDGGGEGGGPREAERERGRRRNLDLRTERPLLPCPTGLGVLVRNRLK